jgi:hypothetical protein
LRHPYKAVFLVCGLLAQLGFAPVSAATDGSAPALEPLPMTGPPAAYLGMGASLCGQFVRAIETERRARPESGAGPDTYFTRDYAAYFSWADGYITAMNELAADREDRLAGGLGSNHETRMRWLEMFCRANPDAHFFGAVYRLREYLLNERQ